MKCHLPHSPSCDPNLEIHNVFINNIDVSMPYLALFSCRDIAKGEELSFDYLMSGATEDTEDVLDVSALENGRVVYGCCPVFFLSATEFTIPWRTIIRHGGCRLCVCVCVCLSVCPGANFATG